MLTASEISKLLNEFGKLTDLSGETFKARAYYVAAENLLAHPTPLEQVIAQNKLRTIPGVGEAIAEKIMRLHRTGSHPTLDFMRQQYPAGLLEMFEIPGLGAKKIEIIYGTLKLSTLEELEAACKDGRIAECKGLGKAIQAKIVKGLEMMRSNKGALLADAADNRLHGAVEQLRASSPELKKVEAAGEVRRGCEVVTQLTIAVCSEEGASVVAPQPEITIAMGTPENYGAALIFATGSNPHLDGLKKCASDLGLTLSEKGLFNKKKLLDCATEEDVYGALKLSYIPPELREGLGEIEAARKGAPKLVALTDLRGILHSHTTYSDGARSLADMAEAVRKRGYQYYGVADHSKSAAYAGGLKEDRVKEQQQLADSLNKDYASEHAKGKLKGGRFKIFKGIESDILEDGSLDYAPDVLASFDFIVASIHSRFSLTRPEQTARLINAVSNPRTTILGHMTGRLLLKRDGYDVDIDAVLKACAEHGVAVEINAHPPRLDLDWRYHQRALELGCMLSINPDAHDISEIDLVRYGVNVARKGGVPPDHVLNCKPLDEIEAYFAKRK